MNQEKITIRRALISVSNKTGIVEFAQGLAQLGVEIISTGGTSQLFREKNIPVYDVADITGFPEIMDGRVKTLHPKIHGGILGLRDQHAAIAKEQQIHWIDLVIVNLYPFAATIRKPNVSWDEAIENIDIGGPTMIRSAAKNMGWVGVVVDPEDYSKILQELSQEKGLNYATRKQLAVKAFGHTADYDRVIFDYLNSENKTEKLILQLNKSLELRYGENPHQPASAYQFEERAGILAAKQIQGKELSYNNIADADAAFSCVKEFSEPTCVIVKHGNPCGVATAENITEAFARAFSADSVSAFGGIIALNHSCTREVAEKISQIFFEVLLAPNYSAEALEILARKPNLRVLQVDFDKPLSKQELKFVEGGLLIQDKNLHVLTEKDLKIVTKVKPTKMDIENMLFAWHVVKHIKSNAILIAKNNVTVGIGAGQVSRIDSVELAIKKSKDNLADTVLASDAFFPFRDSIDRLAHTGVRAIIQPGGSVKDEEVIAACDEYGISMVFTGSRCFKH